jgi:hypothetical protein
MAKHGREMLYICAGMMFEYVLQEAREGLSRCSSEFYLKWTILHGDD